MTQGAGRIAVLASMLPLLIAAAEIDAVAAQAGEADLRG